MDIERAKLGLDKPIWQQFTTWLAGLLRLDLGRSMWTGSPITEEIRLRFALSLQLALMATRSRPCSRFRWASWPRSSRTPGWTTPCGCSRSPASRRPRSGCGILLILALLVVFKWLPPMVYTPFWVDPRQNLAQLIWPALAVGYRYSAVATRMTRSAMLEVLREDYIRTARAKGLWMKLILTRHALKNAMLPGADGDRARSSRSCWAGWW